MIKEQTKKNILASINFSIKQHFHGCKLQKRLSKSTFEKLNFHHKN